MIMKLNEKYLITTDCWFYAPDGEQYRSVFGTVTDISDSEKVLGLKTNRGSTNWYVTIGNMIVAGCQIHYCIRTDKFSSKPPKRHFEFEDKLLCKDYDLTHVYNADKERNN